MANSNLKEKQEEIEALVLKAQDGDKDAFAELYDILVDPIYRYIFYRVKDEEAEDLTCTVFLKVWENVRRYKRGNSSFSAWVFRIAHNLVIDHYRTSKDGDTTELSVDVPDYKREHNPIKSTEEVIDNQLLRDAISGLKKQYQDIIVYKFINEFSNKEIADILGKSEGSLRILQFRALKSLKKEFDRMGVNYQI